MKTIEEHWQQLADAIMNPAAPAIQRDEMRIAFYGGFSAMLAVNMEIAALPSDLQSVQELEKLWTEARKFADQMVAGLPKNP